MEAGHALSAIATATGGVLHLASGDARITTLVTDSRRPGGLEGALFIALRGPKHDGHHHLNELAERGLRHALIADDATDVPAVLNTIRCTDTLDALQRLAAWHRDQYAIPVIGITGSNGKTVVKEWLYQLLRGTEHIVRSPGSWNSQVGVPLSVWNLRGEHTLGIFEAGISRMGEMERLQAVIRPTLGIFTNLGTAHAEGFPNPDTKASEKFRLFANAKAVVHCADHPLVTGAMDAAGFAGMRLGWSRHHEAFVRVLDEGPDDGGTTFTVLHAGRRQRMRIPFTDGASVENALHCITLLLHMGHDAAWINEGLQRLEPVSMRLRTVPGSHGITLLDDSYSNDLVSLSVALDHQARLAHGRPRVVVLGDLLGPEHEARQRYQQAAQALQEAGVERVLRVGREVGAAHDAFPADATAFTDVEALLASTGPAQFAGSIVLVKGARVQGLERVVERWAERLHGTELEVDLAAVRHNVAHYRALVGPKVKLMAMVKAFGYGSGAPELARALVREGVHYLGVAYADEGIELRQHGIALPILVMNPEPVPMGTLQRFGLEPEVYDVRSLDEALQHARLSGAPFTVHIELDTGMHRLGFGEADMGLLLDRLGDHAPLRIGSIFSHLAASEDAASDAFTHAQLARFKAMADRIDAVLGHRPFRHIANSAGATRFPEARMDMVRLGIGLHGVGATEQETAALLPTVTLRTVVAQVRTVAAGEGIGYGMGSVAGHPRRIAVLPIGYADGYGRVLGRGRGRVLVNGHPAPTVGSICMDMCMVDVTGVACAPGDEVTVIGPGHGLSDLAREMGTIPYEVLTGISQRVRRVYTHE
jgi:alanine racemase